MISNLWTFLTRNANRLPDGMWADIEYARSEQYLKCDCSLAQPLVLLSHNETGMSWNKRVHGELLDVVTWSIHASYILVPAASSAWDASPHFLWRFSTSATSWKPPKSFSFPIPKIPSPTIWLSKLPRPAGFSMTTALTALMRWFIFCCFTRLFAEGLRSGTMSYSSVSFCCLVYRPDMLNNCLLNEWNDLSTACWLLFLFFS